MTSNTTRDILQYFHSAHMELFRNTNAQNQSLKNTQLQRLCNRAVELAENTKHSTIVKEFAQSCRGDDANEVNHWAIKKTLLGKSMMPSDRQDLEKELACFIADFGQAEVGEESDGATAPVEQESTQPVKQKQRQDQSEIIAGEAKVEEPEVKVNAERQDVQGKAEKEKVKIKAEQ